MLAAKTVTQGINLESNAQNQGQSFRETGRRDDQGPFGCVIDGLAQAPKAAMAELGGEYRGKR